MTQGRRRDAPLLQQLRSARAGHQRIDRSDVEAPRLHVGAYLVEESPRLCEDQGPRKAAQTLEPSQDIERWNAAQGG